MSINSLELENFFLKNEILKLQNALQDLNDTEMPQYAAPIRPNVTFDSSPNKRRENETTAHKRQPMLMCNIEPISKDPQTSLLQDISSASLYSGLITSQSPSMCVGENADPKDKKSKSRYAVEIQQLKRTLKAINERENQLLDKIRVGTPVQEDSDTCMNSTGKSQLDS